MVGGNIALGHIFSSISLSSLFISHTLSTKKNALCHSTYHINYQTFHHVTSTTRYASITKKKANKRFFFLLCFCSDQHGCRAVAVPVGTGAVNVAVRRRVAAAVDAGVGAAAPPDPVALGAPPEVNEEIDLTKKIRPKVFFFLKMRYSTAVTPM